MNEPLETMMEVREDFMVSPAGDSDPTFRTAHFLKPISSATSIDGTVSEVVSSYFVSTMVEPKEWPLRVYFKGWRNSHKKWINWVDALHLKYESLWKKVGIFEAIMATKCYIVRNRDLVFGVAEKWCSQTNTFVFPWGEATITLEDIMVLGGYPVLGYPVFTSLENQEMKEVEEKLILAKQELRTSNAYTSAWIDFFTSGSGSGSEIEHEAFLAAWLSVFVFPHMNLVNKSLLPIAILLARGNPIALAPAALASLYKELGVLKEIIVDLTKKSLVGGKLDMELEVSLQSPFYLVQIWVWERFKNLQPVPNLINDGDPIIFKWHKVNVMEIDNVRLALDSAVDDFLWRPYVRYAGKCSVFYPECEIQEVPFEAALDKELASFVTCMRVSQLVGIDSTIMQYFPHRVALQFGMDQDVPDFVPEFNRTRDIAWENYCRPISDGNLYFPSRLFEADVTTRYARWWKQSVLHLHHQDFAKNIVRRKRSARPSKRRRYVVKANRTDNDADVLPEVSPKLVSTVSLGKSCDDGSKTVKVENDADVSPAFLPIPLKIVPFGNSVQDGLRANENTDDGLKANENTDVDVPTSFLPKHDSLSPCICVESRQPVLEEHECGGMDRKLVNVATYECKHLPNQYSSSSFADHGESKVILPLMKSNAKDNTEPSLGSLKEDFDDANGNKELRLSGEKVRLSGIQGQIYSCANVVELEKRISRVEKVITKLKIKRFGNI